MSRPCPMIVGSLREGSSIEDAMERVAAGSFGDFTFVYSAAAPRVFARLARLGCSASEAEEVTQETLARMFQARASYRTGSPVLSWAYAIARHLVIDRARRAKLDRNAQALVAHDVGAQRVAEPDEELSARRMESVVSDMLAKLPHAQAVAFRLVRGEGKSLGAACAELGDTNLAVRLRTFRATRAIRAALELSGYVGREVREDDDTSLAS